MLFIVAYSKKNEFSSDHAQLAAFHAALAHPARIAILKMLASKDCVCGEMVDILPLAQSTVSQHLKVLKAADLICGESKGPHCCYCLNPKALARFTELFQDLLGGIPKPKKCKSSCKSDKCH
jgi:ArsR family transcriptional regulator